VDQPLILQKAGTGFFYYHSNHQGSITHLTDSSGTIANSYVYDSYGRRLSVFEWVIQPYSYTGREFDVESGLYFYRARYNDPATGRFLTEDPIGFGGKDQNLYRYVHNSPIILTDPNGMDTGWPYRPVYDPGIGGGASGYGGGGSYRGSRGAGRSGKSSTSPNGGPESPGKKQARDFVEDKVADLAERLGERARDKIDDLGDSIDRARERMNESKPNNPESEIICPRGAICERRPKDKSDC
jgi:RHS repeat-associated protein